jgi:serine/tyrosine/threonine adenylyltransferase
MSVKFPFDNSYARLPERFFTYTNPTPVKAPRLIRVNHDLAIQLGLDPADLESEEGVAILAGNQIAEGSTPIATAYAGHQFGGFVPQLGDGRAILLGEVIDRSGVRRDIQLKGSGPTPFSRRGDGRAALGPVLREYVVSEAMYALGIPTTRALAAVTTGEKVVRESMLPGGVFTRVASSHIRVGTFQFYAARGDLEAIRILADHVIARHYPHVADAENPYRALLDAVIKAQAELIASWLHVGFIHGVMNTDNMSIAGETIDFGPCAFMDDYNPGMVFSSIDHYGRYAYNHQPNIGVWNLARLAECLVALFSDDVDAAVAGANESLGAYTLHFDAAYEAGMRRKLGLVTQRDEDVELGRDLLNVMAANRADFTLTFRRLCDAAEDSAHDERVRCLFEHPEDFDKWAERWRERLTHEPGDPAGRAAEMRSVNPAYIPRNHRVEAVIRAAVDNDDFKPFQELLMVLSQPFEEQPEFTEYQQPPEEHQRVLQTFCGT